MKNSLPKFPDHSYRRGQENGAEGSEAKEVEVPISPKKHTKDPLFVAGGQGRSGYQVNTTGKILAGLLGIAALAAIASMFFR